MTDCQLNFERVDAKRCLLAALICLIANCSSASLVPVRTARAAAERVIDRADFDHVIDVRVGDVLAVRPPMTAAEWQVMFDPAYLEFQGAPEALRSPGGAGWKFKTILAGETSLTVTPVSRGGANPPRFTVTFHVEP